MFIFLCHPPSIILWVWIVFVIVKKFDHDESFVSDTITGDNDLKNIGIIWTCDTN